VGRHVARVPQEHRVPERQQAAEASKQVERAGNSAKHSAFIRKHRVDPDVRRQHEHADEDRGRGREAARIAAGGHG